MKKTLLFTLALLLMAACNNMPRYTIEGNTGNGGDTLYLFGLDSRHDKIEEIVCDKQGAFTHSIETDTIAPLGLLMPCGDIITLFAEPYIKATLMRDSIKASCWVIKGGKEQTTYDSIAALLTNAGSNSERQAHIEEFARKNPLSNINVEIMRRYAIDTPHPNNGFILGRMKNLGGTLQDNEFFFALKERIENKNSNTPYKLFPAFNYTTADGKKISLKDYKGKTLIVNFWAAWDSLSRTQMKELSKIYQTKDTSKVRMLNISLDYDTAMWKKCITADSIAGDNVCDGKVWDNETVKRFSISNLTFTLITSPYNRIDIFEPAHNCFSQVVDSLCNKYFKE